MAPRLLSDAKLGLCSQFVSQLDLQVPTQSCYTHSYKDTVSQRGGATIGRVWKALKQMFTMLSLHLSVIDALTV